MVDQARKCRLQQSTGFNGATMLNCCAGSWRCNDSTVGVRSTGSFVRKSTQLKVIDSKQVSAWRTTNHCRWRNAATQRATDNACRYESMPVRHSESNDAAPHRTYSPRAMLVHKWGPVNGPLSESLTRHKCSTCFDAMAPHKKARRDALKQTEANAVNLQPPLRCGHSDQ